MHDQRRTKCEKFRVIKNSGIPQYYFNHYTRVLKKVWPIIHLDPPGINIKKTMNKNTVNKKSN